MLRYGCGFNHWPLSSFGGIWYIHVKKMAATEISDGHNRNHVASAGDGRGQKNGLQNPTASETFNIASFLSKLYIWNIAQSKSPGEGKIKFWILKIDANWCG